MSKTCVDSFTVINDKGLHTRPCTELVKCATAFKSHMTLLYGGVCVNAKSLISILMLAATCGSRVTVEAVGEDAEEAVRSILEMACNKFWINY